MNKEQIKIILAFLAIYFIWGSTYLFNKMLLTEFPPFQLSGVRFTVSGIIILIIAILSKTPIKPKKVELKNAFIAGVLFLTLGNGCLVWALQYIDSGFAALLIASQPLILLFMLWILKGQSISLKSYVGVALGILGIYLLTMDQGIGTNISWKGVILISISLLCWGYASIFVGSAKLPKNQFVNSAFQMSISGILLLLASYFFGEDMVSITNLSNKAYMFMVYLIVFGSIIAFSSFNYLLTKVSPEKVATGTYINPLVAVFLGWIVLDEKINATTIVAAFILLTGVYFINSTKKTKA